MDHPISILSLCTGYGGLDLGIELAVPNARVIGGVEWEASCCAVLGQAMRGGLVPAFPVWSDLRSFDGGRWRGCVDILAAGYPCQPFSQAGSRRGTDDPRHLWPHVARITGEVGPECVFFENVEGHVGLGLREVLCDLEGMGYRCAVGLFTARGVGAPHRRRRVFIFGHRVADDQRDGSGQDAARAEGWGPDTDQCGGGVGDTGRQHEQLQQWVHGSEPAAAERRVGDTGIAGCEGLERAGALREPRQAAPGPVAESGGDVELPHGARRQAAGRGPRIDAGREPEQAGCAGVVYSGGDGGRIGEQIGRPDRRAAAGGASRERDLWPPGPSGGGERDRWADIIANFPDFAPATQSVVRGVADGGARRLDHLRMLGNGVVPLEAAYAFVTLAAAAGYGGGSDGDGG